MRFVAFTYRDVIESRVCVFVWYKWPILPSYIYSTSIIGCANDGLVVRHYYTSTSFWVFHIRNHKYKIQTFALHVNGLVQLIYMVQCSQLPRECTYTTNHKMPFSYSLGIFFCVHRDWVNINAHLCHTHTHIVWESAPLVTYTYIYIQYIVFASRVKWFVGLLLEIAPLELRAQYTSHHKNDSQSQSRYSKNNSATKQRSWCIETANYFEWYVYIFNNYTKPYIP